MKIQISKVIFFIFWIVFVMVLWYFFVISAERYDRKSPVTDLNRISVDQQFRTKEYNDMVDYIEDLRRRVDKLLEY